MLHVREIAPSHSTLRDFVRFPLTLYKDNPSYALPSVEQQVRGLLSRHNALLSNGVQAFLMAYDGETPVGRLLAGIDYRAAQLPGKRSGYLSMFECINDQNVADALFQTAEQFFRQNGIHAVIGPTPAMFSDFGAGLLVEGFDLEPSFLSPYNPPFYPQLFEGAGFEKYHDHFSYSLPLDDIRDDRYESVLRRASKRFSYTVESINLKQDLKGYAREFARIIAESTPPEWDMAVPSADTILRELKRIKPALWQDFVLIARAGSRPIGLLFVIPDFFPLLKGLKGRMFPVGTFRMLFSRSYVKRLRTVMLYVAPDYQNKGVEATMIYRALDAARLSGIRYAEASMVNDQNLKLQLGLEKLGGSVSKIHRQYIKNI